MKIYQSVFVRDQVIEEKFTNCNTNIIPIKVGSCIKMIDIEDYKKADLRIYQKLIKKLIYLLCDIRLDIAFVIGQFSKYYANQRKYPLWAVKIIIRYLKETIKMDLIFDLESI